MTEKAGVPTKRVDLVRDLTKAFRIGKRVFEGELSLAQVFLENNDVGSEQAREGEPRCDKTPGCTCTPDHEGGCVLEATVVE